MDRDITPDDEIVVYRTGPDGTLIPSGGGRFRGLLREGRSGELCMVFGEFTESGEELFDGIGDLQLIASIESIRLAGDPPPAVPND